MLTASQKFLIKNLKSISLCMVFWVKINFKKVPAVDGVFIWYTQKKVFGLVGESGCGKTTLGRTIVQTICIKQMWFCLI